MARDASLSRGDPEHERNHAAASPHPYRAVLDQLRYVTRDQINKLT